MNLVSRSGSVDSQVIVFREIRGKDEYIKRLGDVEFGFDQLSRQPGSMVLLKFN